MVIFAQMFFAIFKLDFCIAICEQHPLVLMLTIPKTIGTGVAKRQDSFYPDFFVFKKSCYFFSVDNLLVHTNNYIIKNKFVV